MQACHRVSTDLYVYSIFTDKPNFSYASNLSNGTRFVCLVLLNFLFSQGTFVDMHLHVGTLPMYPEGQSSKTYRVCNFFNRFVPKDNNELLSEDPNTFEYLYAQVSYLSSRLLMIKEGQRLNLISKEPRKAYDF